MALTKKDKMVQEILAKDLELCGVNIDKEGKAGKGVGGWQRLAKSLNVELVQLWTLPLLPGFIAFLICKPSGEAGGRFCTKKHDRFAINSLLTIIFVALFQFIIFVFIFFFILFGRKL